MLHARVEVVEQMLHLGDGRLLVGPPKSDAGRRTVAIPAAIIPDLEEHLARWAAPGKEGLVFCGFNGQPLRRGTFYAAWNKATKATASKGCICMICDTPGIPSPPQPAPAPRN
ncbi:MAG TPA: hypothetical protein VK988_04925 [Acidimicrobiales bacterium]|nr:hypothetical protein [Acidimicrobiales bacterium]